MSRNKFTFLIKSNEPISLTCKICQKECKNEIALAAHLSAHKVKFRDYLVKYYLNDEHPKCLECGKETEYRKGKEAGFYRYCPEHNHMARTDWNKENGFGKKVDATFNKGKTKETCESIKIAASKRILKEETFNVYVKKIKRRYKTDIKYSDYYDREQPLSCICKKCGTKLDSTFTNFRNYSVRCYKCNPNGSIAEKEFVDEIMKTFNIHFNDVKRNSRAIIAPHEIDLFIPEKNLGIEYHGLFWHSYPNKPKNYHQDKALAALKSGNQILQFFSDEVEHKKDIVLSIIANKIGKSNKFDARKMTIKTLSAKEAGQFYESNHLSGRGRLNNKHNYALMQGDEIMSCLSLGKYLTTDSFEIMRFANKLNSNVRGAFSKLLSHFIKSNGYSGDIFSYCDLRIGNGSVYLANGFSYVKTTKPDYWYTDNKKREHRFKYRAQDGKSEVEYAKSKNVSAIYGAGSHLYKKTV